MFLDFFTDFLNPVFNPFSIASDVGHLFCEPPTYHIGIFVPLSVEL